MSFLDREELLAQLVSSMLLHQPPGGGKSDALAVQRLEDVERGLREALDQLRRGRQTNDISVVTSAVGGTSTLARMLERNPLWFECAPLLPDGVCTAEALANHSSRINMQLDVVEAEIRSLTTRIQRALMAARSESPAGRPFIL